MKFVFEKGKMNIKVNTNMKKKIFSLLAVVMTVMTASADVAPYKITVGTNEHGTFAFEVNGTAQTPDGNGAIAADEGDDITLTITPDEYWAVGTPSGVWYAQEARAPHRVDMLKDFALNFVSEDATTKARTYTFEMIRANAEISCTYTDNPKITGGGGITIVDDGNDIDVEIDDTEDNMEGVTLPEGLVVDELDYSRELEEGENAYTTCLPYAPPTSEDLTYYTLVGVSEGTLYFDEIEGTPQAYTPYLVVANETTSIGKDNVTDVTIVKTVANEASAGDYVLKGTLSGIQHADAIGFYILQPGNRWGKVGSNANAYIPPFRAYIEATSAGAPEMLGSSFDGNTTGIENIRTVDLNGTERWYDLNGRRIATPAKGINILNGKKVVVK